MEDILRKQRERRMKTPAELVPPAAMDGEHTYGFFPSARDIKHAERRKEVKRERAAINKIWNVYPTLTPRTGNPSQTDYSSNSYSMVTSRQSVNATPSLTNVEKPEKYEVVNIGAYFGHTEEYDRRKRHFFVSPEWQSEKITVKRMDKNKQSNPLKYGWI